MDQMDTVLKAASEQLSNQDLWRTLRRVDGVEGVRATMAGGVRVSFASNDYLGLAGHPLLREAAIRAVERWGAGSSASRLVSGSLGVHHALEEAIATWKGTAAALSFSTGYATAMGVVPALVGPGDVVILDKLVHACCVDAAKLSGAEIRVFRHNDLDSLESRLRWAAKHRGGSTAGVEKRRPRILVVTESVFSMDGDLAPLKEIVSLKERYGAWLLLDEAHAVGLFGERRSGLAEAFDVQSQVEIQMGTLGKALGAAGGYVAGSRSLIDWLINRARSFVFSTAPAPAQAAAAQAAVSLVAGAEGRARAERLWAVVDLAKNEFTRAGWSPGLVRSAILPLAIGPESEALAIARLLDQAGWLVPAIRYPTVARGTARLRVTLSAGHQADQIRQFAGALKQVGEWRRQGVIATDALGTVAPSEPEAPGGA